MMYSAKKLQRMGQGGDSLLAHINPAEAQLLKAAGGSGKRNPKTGLLSFEPETTWWNGAPQPEPMMQPTPAPMAPMPMMRPPFMPKFGRTRGMLGFRPAEGLLSPDMLMQFLRRR